MAPRESLKIRADLIATFKLPATATLDEIWSALEQWLEAAPEDGWPELEGDSSP